MSTKQIFMKEKIYSIALLASLAVSAAAAEDFPIKIGEFSAGTPQLVKIDAEKVNKLQNHALNRAKAPAATGDNLVAEYLLSYNNQYGTTVEEFQFFGETTISEGTVSGEYSIMFPFYNYGDYIEMPIPVTVTGDKLSLINGNFSMMGETFKLTTAEINDEGVLETCDKIEVPFNGSGFLIPQDKAFLIGDDSGFYVFANNASFQKPDTQNSELQLGWTSLGMAKFQDGWVMPLFLGEGEDLADTVYEVEIQQNDANSNIYRLVNPYGVGSPFEEVNEYAKRNGFVQFNVSDPDHVYFDVVPSNFCFQNVGVLQLFAMNQLTWLMGIGYFLEDVIEQYGDVMMWTTFKDGVLTVPSVPASNGGYSNDAQFGVNDDPYSGSVWGSSNIYYNMECKIWFPGSEDNGVEGIEFDENAPVKYFNLQGVEVANPAKGQLVIKTQGSKAQKMIVR